MPRDANEDDLRKAYRKQCLKYHPDKQAGADDAEKARTEAMFKDVGEAYQILNDAAKRRQYDQGVTFNASGDVDMADAHEAHAGRGGGGFGGFGEAASRTPPRACGRGRRAAQPLAVCRHRRLPPAPRYFPLARPCQAAAAAASAACRRKFLRCSLRKQRAAWAAWAEDLAARGRGGGARRAPDAGLKLRVLTSHILGDRAAE